MIRVVGGIGALGFCLLHVTRSTEAQSQKYETLGYRSCGTERGTCHQSDGGWWQGDAHARTVSDLKRKQQRSTQIAQAYGMNAADYLKGNSACAACHGEVVSGREERNMNTGVSCESCHGAAGPKGMGYYEVHQEGANPADPLATNRVGYQKALKVGMRRLRDVNVRAQTCVRCHLINEKKLLEAGHPTGDGFDYVAGIKSGISRHWDYQVRQVDLDRRPYDNVLKRKPIPQFTVKTVDAPAVMPVAAPDTVFVTVGRALAPWLSANDTIAIRPFEPGISSEAPLDSILLRIKQYIEYVHERINTR